MVLVQDLTLADLIIMEVLQFLVPLHQLVVEEEVLDMELKLLSKMVLPVDRVVVPVT